MRLEKQIANQRIVLGPLNAENGAGFAAFMDPKDAYRIGAPHSDEFFRLLEERVIQEERLNNHKFCEFGYEIGNSGASVYAGIWQVWLMCKPNKKE